MKSYLLLSTMSLLTLVYFSYAQNANQKLSNLTAPTAINATLLPGTTNTSDLGSAFTTILCTSIITSLALKK